MKKDIYFSASADITRRAGIISSRYRTKEGRFIITDKDLVRVQLVMTPEEFMHGVDIIEITEREANRLIAENGYQLGEEYIEDTSSSSSSEEAPAVEEQESSSSEEENNESEE
jgi:hypothetical protein